MTPTILEDASRVGINFSKYLLKENTGIDLEKLEDSSYLLDILIQLENVLDKLDLWVYANWFEGEVAKGPIVRRHWISFSLLYPPEKMPDPRAALRLMKHGIQVEFNKIKRTVPADVCAPAHEPSKPSDWLITVTIPRRLLDQTEEADLNDDYEEEIDTDDVTAAKDIGLDNESTYQQDEQLPGGEVPPDQQAPAADPAGGLPPPR